jgi:hypothetical protein
MAGGLPAKRGRRWRRGEAMWSWEGGGRTGYKKSPITAA